MSGLEAALPAEKEEESEEESEVLEESPCGRWQKRREQVNQGNMPGIQSTFLAMDTEEGVEVVWNELHFTDKKAFKAHEEKINTMFEQLVVVDHPNIVKLHKYWLDVKDSKARVIFITEYVSSGSLKQFLKKTKKNHKAMNARAWKRWCTQILSALSFLHSCDPPIIHGNLTSDTIFIQHNGLIKIGSVWHRVFANAIPDDLRSPIRIEREEQRNLHFFPPEYGHLMPENVVEEKTKELDLNMVMAEIRREGLPAVQWRYSEVSFLELDKFLEDVRNGIYPLMNFAATRPLLLPRALSQPQEDPQKAKTPTPEPFDVETRKVVQMQCSMEMNEEKAQWHLTLLLTLEDKLHRQLSYDLLPIKPVSAADSSKGLASELVHYGFIHEDDCEMLANFLENAFHKHRSPPL
ncbi:nuclear receptor-binding protein 2 isoform X13 [Chelonia mydas]|uniref:nuclear receptor-binding protein 2 isoform X13 n=1 Tax=Chelonia mydas TaxID=8469 RepID=UPI001CA9AC5D|nr:nuclear receptor-binding protein 2 isoform X13 [Chelonia mydas]